MRSQTGFHWVCKKKMLVGLGLECSVLGLSRLRSFAKLNFGIVSPSSMTMTRYQQKNNEELEKEARCLFALLDKTLVARGKLSEARS